MFTLVSALTTPTPSLLKTNLSNITQLHDDNLGLTWRNVGNFQKKLLRVHTAFLPSRSHIHALDPQRKDRLQAVYVANESILHKD